jgi:beta-galactosidase/beta-glucuronidase
MTAGGRSFLINGAPIFLAGGNWIGTDQLLRYSTDRQRYYNEVRMHKEMGMNLIRVWGGGVTERPEFYEAADELGVLVMQEFWMTGDNNGRWGETVIGEIVSLSLSLACTGPINLTKRADQLCTLLAVYSGGQ